MRAVENFRRFGRTGAVTVTAVAAVTCLAAGSAASGAGPRDAGAPHPNVTEPRRCPVHSRSRAATGFTPPTRTPTPSP
jgi:hypothetical protein